MSNLILAPYSNGQRYTISTTKLGAVETSLPHIYEKGLPDRQVFRYDAYQTLEDVIDAELLADRRKLYILLSGSGVDNTMYRKIFERCYLDYPRFRFYVDTRFFFRLPDEDLLVAVIKPLRERVDKALQDAHPTIGGKFLMQTHDYVYLSFVKDIEVNPKGCVKL